MSNPVITADVLDYCTQNPKATLRSIAAALGISTGSAHKARQMTDTQRHPPVWSNDDLNRLSQLVTNGYNRQRLCEALRIDNTQLQRGLNILGQEPRRTRTIAGVNYSVTPGGRLIRLTARPPVKPDLIEESDYA